MVPRFNPALFLCVFFGLLAPLWALTQVNVGEDQANQGMYNGGWNAGSGGDNGFFAWKMVAKADGEESFAGHYLGKVSERSELAPITTDRVFSLFANGKSYEESVAFRGIAVPLEPGDNFTFEIVHGPFQQKSDTDDPAPSEVGVTYRTGNADGAVTDIETGARLRFFAREGSPNYFITDSETEFDTGIPITQEAVALDSDFGRSRHLRPGGHQPQRQFGSADRRAQIRRPSRRADREPGVLQPQRRNPRFLLQQLSTQSRHALSCQLAT